MRSNVSWEEILSLPAGEAGPVQIEMLRAQGWDAQPTDMRSEYRQRWTLWHSLREAVQNSFDEAGAAEVEVIRAPDGHVATVISDEGKGFAAQALLLGEAKGATPEQVACLRGRFGEGMKLGVLPVLRAGGRVLIRTTGLDATFAVGETKLAGQSVRVVYRFTRANRVTRGTTVVIEGLDATSWRVASLEEGTQYIDLRQRFTPFIPAKDVVVTVRDGCKTHQLFRNHPGEVFVRDIFVEKREDFLWGYNFWFDDSVATLDPDRDHLKESPTSWRMNMELSTILKALSEEQLREYFQSFRGKENSWEWAAVGDAMGADYDDKAFAQRVANAVAANEGTSDFSWGRDDADRKAIEHHGTRNLDKVYPVRFLDLLNYHKLAQKPEEIRASVGMGHIVLDERGLKTFLDEYVLEGPEGPRSYETSEAAKARVEEFKKFVLANYRLVVKRLDELLFKIAKRVTHPGFQFYLKPKDTDDRATGFAKTEEGQVFIDAAECYNVLETFIHEAAHVRSKASDLTDDFERGLVNVGLAFAEVNAERKAWVKGLKEAIQRFQGASTYWKPEKASEEPKYRTVQEALRWRGYTFFWERSKKGRKGVQGFSGFNRK